MRTFKVNGDELVESDTPAVVLSHQFRTGYRVRTSDVHCVLDPEANVVSVHASFTDACERRDRLNGVTS